MSHISLSLPLSLSPFPTLFLACVVQSDVSSKPARADRSPIPRKGDRTSTAAAGDGSGGGGGTSDPQTTAAASAAATAAAAAAVTGSRADGRSGSEEDFGPVGGPRHLTKLVLKFTTASESDVQPSCEVLACARARYFFNFLASVHGAGARVRCTVVCVLRYVVLCCAFLFVWS